MTAKIFLVYTKTIWYWLAIVGSQESRGNMAGFVGVEVLRREAGVRRRHGGFARVKEGGSQESGGDMARLCFIESV